MWRRFLGQVLEPIVAILIAAAAVSGLLGDASETLAIVLLNGIIGSIQEERAELALGPTAAVGPPGRVDHTSGRKRCALRSDRPTHPGSNLAARCDLYACHPRLVNGYSVKKNRFKITDSRFQMYIRNYM
jgi:hypothetical protein